MVRRSRCRPSAARPARSRSCSASWSTRSAGSASSGSCIALSYCTLLPGPEAQQLAIYVGWLLNGVRGGLVAGVLFVLPGRRRAAGALGRLRRLRRHHARRGALPRPRAGGHRDRRPGRGPGRAQGPGPPGARRAGGRVVRRADRSSACRSRSSCSRPRSIGWVLGPLASRRCTAAAKAGRATTGRRRWSATTRCTTSARPARRAAPGPGDRAGACGSRRSAARRARRSAATSIFVDQGLFFSGAAVVTFGGAYAVLAYVAQQAVEVYGWLAPGEMVRGLALAETTPGPLIMVVQFVAFVGAYRDPGALDPWVAAVARGAADDLGDVRAVLPLHPARGAVRRAAPRQPRPRRRAGRASPPPWSA